jgi:hypothetical protein
VVPSPHAISGYLAAGTQPLTTQQVTRLPISCFELYHTWLNRANRVLDVHRMCTNQADVSEHVTLPHPPAESHCIHRDYVWRTSIMFGALRTSSIAQGGNGCAQHYETHACPLGTA